MPETTTINPNMDDRLAKLERSKRAEGKSELVQTPHGRVYRVSEIGVDDLDKIFGADEPQQEEI